MGGGVIDDAHDVEEVGGNSARISIAIPRHIPAVFFYFCNE
jgi:hypothetical protein